MVGFMSPLLLPRHALHPSNEWLFLGLNCVVLWCWLTWWIMSNKSFVSLLLITILGLIATSSLTGLLETQVASKHLLEIMRRTLWISYPLTGGDLSKEARIRQTVPPEVYSGQSYWPMTCGGTDWISFPTLEWPDYPNTPSAGNLSELTDVCHQASVLPSVMILSQHSSFTRLIGVTAWVMRFICVCRGHPKQGQQTSQTQQMQTLRQMR